MLVRFGTRVRVSHNSFRPRRSLQEHRDGGHTEATWHHHFTTAYSPWANGTVEAVCKQTIRAARAMLSEMHLAPQEWPCVLPAIQAVLNNSPSSHRAGQTPLTAFTGHARDTYTSLFDYSTPHCESLSIFRQGSKTVRKYQAHPTSRATSQGSNGQGIPTTT
jgi:hypothetical protein